jgi:hypothetical protein
MNRKVIDVLPTTRSTRAEFTPPQTLEEADIRKNELLRCVDDIDIQLKDLNVTTPSGRRLSPTEYNDLRKQLTRTQADKRAEVRQINACVRELANAKRNERRASDGTNELLAQAYVLLEFAEDDGFVLPEKAKDLMDRIANTLPPAAIQKAEQELAYAS